VREAELTDRIYLVTPPTLGPRFADDLAAVLDAGGIACVRLQIDGSEDAIRHAADALRAVCTPREMPLVIADHVRLVAPHGLDGVHLTDGAAQAVRAARSSLGAERIVGAFGGTTRHRGMLLAEAGADYVALGPVRAGALGDGAEADADLFAWWDEMIDTPSVAEGGLTPELAAGLRADFFAPRLSLWQHPDGPVAGLRAYRAALG
jgi:thiamine-phosphate pyrophosphorylase